MEVAEVTFGEVDQGFADNCLVCNGNDQVWKFLEWVVIKTVMMVMTKATRMTMTKIKPFEDLAEFGNLVSGSPLTR